MANKRVFGNLRTTSGISGRFQFILGNPGNASEELLMSSKEFGSSYEGFGWFLVWVQRPWVTFGIFGCLRLILQSVNFTVVLSDTISRVSILFTALVTRISQPLICNKYTLFDGFTDNTRGYFTSCVVCGARKNASNEENVREYYR